MNEAVSRIDMEQDNSRPYMQTCLFRNLKEVLNLKIENYDVGFDFGNLFLLNDPLKFGICVFVAIKARKVSKRLGV